MFKRMVIAMVCAAMMAGGLTGVDLIKLTMFQWILYRIYKAS